jgi:hypothetical protein
MKGVYSVKAIGHYVLANLPYSKTWTVPCTDKSIGTNFLNCNATSKTILHVVCALRTCRYYKCDLHFKSAVRGARVAQIVHETLKSKTFYTIYYKQVKQMVTPIVLALQKAPCSIEKDLSHVRWLLGLRSFCLKWIY